jgi:heme/copper-type cytochrome/quinol oxidase subunit 2
MIHINPQITPINLKNIKLDKKYSTVPGLLRWIKEEAEVLWFAVMLVLVIGFFSWTLVDLTTGVSTSYRYGLPLFSGLPAEAQEAVEYFQAHPPSNNSEVVNGILVVNVTITQYNFTPDLIQARVGEPVVLILNSPDLISAFYMRLPSGVINVNVVPGMPSYAYFLAPNSPGNYTWRESEYVGWGTSYMTGTLEVEA